MKADGQQIPFIVARNGGYYNLSKLKTDAAGKKPTPGQQTEPDGQGNTITLEQYNDTDYGFLRITIDAASIEVQALGVDLANLTAVPAVLDSFTLDLSKRG